MKIKWATLNLLKLLHILTFNSKILAGIFRVIFFFQKFWIDQLYHEKQQDYFTLYVTFNIKKY